MRGTSDIAMYQIKNQGICRQHDSIYSTDMIHTNMEIFIFKEDLVEA